MKKIRMTTEAFIIGVRVDVENLKEAQDMILKNDHIFQGISYCMQDYKIPKNDKRRK